jgi:hypothetical protein
MFIIVARSTLQAFHESLMIAIGSIGFTLFVCLTRAQISVDAILSHVSALLLLNLN